MFVCVCQNYWGRGETVDAAKKQARKEGGKLDRYVIFECEDPKVYVDEMGYFCHKEGTTLKEVSRFPKNLR